MHLTYAFFFAIILNSIFLRRIHKTLSKTEIIQEGDGRAAICCVPRKE